MPPAKGTVLGRMAHGTCQVCGQEDVAITRAGKVHPLHVKFSQRHRDAVELAEQKQGAGERREDAR